MTFIQVDPSGASVANLMYLTSCARAEAARSSDSPRTAENLEVVIDLLQESFGAELGGLVGQARLGEPPRGRLEDLRQQLLKELAVLHGDRVPAGVEDVRHQVLALRGLVSAREGDLRLLRVPPEQARTRGVIDAEEDVG